MLNILYKNCRKGSESLTPKALRRLRIFSIFAVIGFPLFMLLATFDVLDGMPRLMNGLVTGILLASSTPLAASGFYNQMSKRDSRLDEWELAQKQKAEAFTYRFIMVGTISGIVFALLMLAATGLDFDTVSFSFANVLSIFMTLAIIYLFLPITYIAWTQNPIPLED